MGCPWGPWAGRGQGRGRGTPAFLTLGKKAAGMDDEGPSGYRWASTPGGPSDRLLRVLSVGHPHGALLRATLCSGQGHSTGHRMELILQYGVSQLLHY